MEEVSMELRNELLSKLKFSKHVIDLRHKEKMLVKMKNYTDADTIKAKADALQESENYQKHLEVYKSQKFISFKI